MRLLRRAQLHAGDHQKTRLRARLHRGGAVQAGIMIRQRNYLHPLQRRHVYKVVGGHIVIPAGGETGMQVKIVIQFHIDTLMSLFLCRAVCTG